MNRILSLIFISLSFQSYAQDVIVSTDSLSRENVAHKEQVLINSVDTTDYVTLYKQEYEIFLKLDDELKGLKTIRKRIQDENKILQESLNSKRSLLNDKEQTLSRNKTHLEGTGVEELRKKQKQLLQDIVDVNSDITKIKAELDVIDKEVGLLQDQRNDLVSIKEDKSRQILEKYGPYLEQPFSALTSEVLSDIKKECSGYTVDQQINAFSVRTDKMVQYKRIYDRAKEICSSKFNKFDVQNSLEAISSIKDVNNSQAEEINVLKSQLERFEEGVLVFKEFIERLNSKRSGMTRYSSSDFSDDFPFIVQGLEDRIEQFIISVPYLNQEYSKYMDAIRSNPMQHPEIEKEILGF